MLIYRCWLLSLTLLFLLGTPAGGQMCQIKLSSPTQQLGGTGKQKVFLEAAFSQTYSKLPVPVEPVQRQPMNVGFVLDVSGSMTGEPLESAKRAIITILNNLFPGDVVSLTVFNEKGTVLLPFAQIGGVNSAGLREGVGGIIASGGTCLYSGVEQGAKTVLANMGTGYDNCLIVVSDGESSETADFMTNVGVKLNAASIRVISIGLTFDNPLLQALSSGNGGEYHHIGQAEELAMILLTALEKNDPAQTAAFDNRFTLKLPPGVVLTRSTARIIGSKTFKDKSSAYYFYRFGLPEKSVYTELFEVEVSRQLKKETPLAEISVSYVDGVQVNLKEKEKIAAKNKAEGGAQGAKNPIEEENDGEANDTDEPVNIDGQEDTDEQEVTDNQEVAQSEKDASVADDTDDKEGVPIIESNPKSKPDRTDNTKPKSRNAEAIFEEDTINKIADSITSQIKQNGRNAAAIPDPAAKTFRLDLKNMERSVESDSIIIPCQIKEKSIINAEFYREMLIRFEVAGYDQLYVMVCKGNQQPIITVLKNHSVELTKQIKSGAVAEETELLRQFKQNIDDLSDVIKKLKPSSIKKQMGKRNGQASQRRQPVSTKPDNPFIDKLNVLRRDLLDQWQQLRQNRSKPVSEKQAKEE